jgi:hypothetical protein
MDCYNRGYSELTKAQKEDVDQTIASGKK